MKRLFIKLLYCLLFLALLAALWSLWFMVLPLSHTEFQKGVLTVVNILLTPMYIVLLSIVFYFGILDKDN